MDPVSGNLKPVLKRMDLGPSNDEYREVNPHMSLSRPSRHQQKPAEDGRMGELERANAELNEKCFHLELQVAQLDMNDQICLFLERQKTELEAKRKELADQCRTLEESNAELRQSLKEFNDVLNIKSNQIHLGNKKLGQGSYANVYIGKWQGLSVAIKKFHHLIISRRNLQMFQREILVSSRLHHPNILTVCGAVMADGVPLQMVSELLEGSVSELMDAAHASGLYLTINEQLSVAKEITSAIAYLHQLLPKPYVHSDICSRNILVGRDMKVKVADLGAAHLLESSLTAGPVSPPYSAPERRESEGPPARSSLKTDVYSLGVTLIEILTGVGPIVAQRKTQLRGLADRRGLYRICSGMIEEKPVNRPSADECLKSIEREVEVIFGSASLPMNRLVVGKFDGEYHKLILLNHIV